MAPTKKKEKLQKITPEITHKSGMVERRKGPIEWSAVIGEIAAQGRKSCTFCLGRRVSITNSLQSLYLEIAKDWHPTKNGKLTP